MDEKPGRKPYHVKKQKLVSKRESKVSVVTWLWSPPFEVNNHSRLGRAVTRQQLCLETCERSNQDYWHVASWLESHWIQSELVASRAFLKWSPHVCQTRAFLSARTVSYFQVLNSKSSFILPTHHLLNLSHHHGALHLSISINSSLVYPQHTRIS